MHLIFKETKDDEELEKETEKFGWLTNVATKPKMLYNLRTFINEDLIDIPDPQIIDELRTYPKDKVSETRFKKDEEHHWDLVISLAIALQMQSHALQGFQNTKTYSTSSTTTKDPYSAI